jgi:CheY-like chemotaxis protein
MISVLVIDDLAIVREPLKALLAGEGFSVRSAANGADAIALAQESMPDAVLLDLSMPGISGVAFLERLRAFRGGAGVAVIVLTAQEDPALQAKLLKMGVEGFVLKSQFSAGDIVSRLRRAVGKPPSPSGADTPAKPAEMGRGTPVPAPSNRIADPARLGGQVLAIPLWSVDLSA